MSDWGPCKICGETIEIDDVVECVKPDGTHILAHVDCAQNERYPMA